MGDGGARAVLGIRADQTLAHHQAAQESLRLLHAWEILDDPLAEGKFQTRLGKPEARRSDYSPERKSVSRARMGYGSLWLIFALCYLSAWSSPVRQSCSACWDKWFHDDRSEL